MKIKVAPFVSVAKPMNAGPLAKAYWQSDIDVQTIAGRFMCKSGKAARNMAGKAALQGICCRDCKSEIVCDSRDNAIQVIKEFESAGSRGIQCLTCYRADRDKRRRGAGRKSDAEHQRPAAKKPKRARRGPVLKTEKEEFYNSWEWQTLRFKVLQKYGRACLCCGARPGMLEMSGDPVQIVVDHIKPISKYWHLRKEESNLQVLCAECNQGKGNWDETDFRSPEAPDEWVELPQDDIALTVLAEMNGETIN